MVAYLGQLEPQRLGVKEAAEGGQGLRQKRLFDDVLPQALPAFRRLLDTQPLRLLKLPQISHHPLPRAAPVRYDSINAQ